MHTNDGTRFRVQVSTGGGEIMGTTWGRKADSLFISICGKKRTWSKYT